MLEVISWYPHNQISKQNYKMPQQMCFLFSFYMKYMTISQLSISLFTQVQDFKIFVSKQENDTILSS